MVFRRKVRGDKVIPVLQMVWSESEKQAVALVQAATGSDVASVGIDFAHNEIHEGNYYTVSYKSPDAAPIANDGTIALVITSGAKEIHMLFQGAGGGDAEAELYEGTQFTGGTAMTEFNRKRSSSNIALTTVVRDPAIGVVGTLLFNSFLPGGSGPLSVGGAQSTRNEWILAPNTVYMARITNRSGGAQPMSISFEWYEEDV